MKLHQRRGDVLNLADGKSVGKYDFVAKANRKAEIFLYGPIGDYFGEGISARRFSKELKALGNLDEIELRIDSPGGSVTEGRAIYTLLVENKARVNIFIDGAAASAASYVAMSGDEIAIAEGGLFMIHEARTIAIGTASDFEKTATLLRTLNTTIADTYAARTKMSRAKLLGLMADETWYTGKEAVDAGFADRVMANKQAAEACAFSRQFFNEFKRVPASISERAVRRRQIATNCKRLLENV